MAINPETQYPGKIAPSSAQFPYGAARNITVPGDGTGTPWEAALVNDLFGFQQSLLSSAGLVPSGTPEEVGASQYLDSMNLLKTTPVLDIATMAADTNAKAGTRYETDERTTGKAGGATYLCIVTGTTAGVDLPDTFSIIISTSDALLSFILIRDRVILPEVFGAFADNSTTITAALQAYADYCIDNDLQFTWGYPLTTGDAYKIDASIKFSEPCNINSIGKAKGRLLCVNCDGFDFTGSSATPTNMTIEKSYFAQSVRHTTTPNSFSPVVLQGSTGSRPFWNTIKNCFFDGFGAGMDWQWVWSTTVTDCRSVFGGKFINGVGKSVNNHIYQNEISGNAILIDIGDGVETMEGWHVSHNLFDGLNLGAAIDAVGAGFGYFHHNICDFMGPVTAILVRSAGTLATTGWDIHHNYVAFSAAGNHGVRLLNNVVPGATNKGHTVDSNRIFAYPGGSLSRGIFTDGSEEENNIISSNKVEASLGDCDITGAVGTQVLNNKWFGAGFATTANCIYANNEGTIVTSLVFLTERMGNNTVYLNNSMPASGTYVAGDVVKNTTPVVLGAASSQYVIKSWERLTTGSGNVLNTDWVEGRVLTGT